ncbi:hypothetical protein IDJ77_23415 [Mucilaginibacter sp. ZT4R22]|uniref:Uncharacterized protein n=1 Tax=Mucilaginibacter pankratovii TaxID=2772110 RepID=A0ABR7WWW6_9SPHI|nr:hypothetical protein [Mucilaginibacter pankratovii]MBD1366780.1 hypothetical protein [Mucilaginibacter pankratovii]
MKKYLLLCILWGIFFTAKAQTAIGPIEQRMTDSLCKCLVRLDVSKITTKQQAVSAYTGCVQQNANLLPDLADEKKVDMTDQVAMRAIGIDLGKNLMKQKCDAFMKLSTAMVQKEAEDAGNFSDGTFKRIDSRGFNYIVISDRTGSEKSFLWLRQFPGSEKLQTPAAQLTGKKMKITWQEMEVYLPQAKGYYKVKEITAVEFL